MLTYDRTKSGQAKYDILEENKQNEPQREPEPEKKSESMDGVVSIVNRLAYGSPQLLVEETIKRELRQ